MKKGAVFWDVQVVQEAKPELSTLLTCKEEASLGAELDFLGGLREVQIPVA